MLSHYCHKLSLTIIRHSFDFLYKDFWSVIYQAPTYLTFPNTCHMAYKKPTFGYKIFEVSFQREIMIFRFNNFILEKNKKATEK